MKNIWKAPPKNPGRLRGLTPEGKGHIQPSARAWPYVQFGGSKTWPKEKNGGLSLSWTNGQERSLSPPKTLVLRLLSRLGVKVQAIIAGTSYAFWDILFTNWRRSRHPNPQNFGKQRVFSSEQNTWGDGGTTVSVYEVPSFLRGRLFSRVSC